MTVRQAANTLQILEYFAGRRRPASAAEIAEALGWPRSSTFKLIGTLSALGYLYEPGPRSGLYPTPRWLELAERVAEGDPLPPQLHHLVRSVRDATGETVGIAAPAGLHAMFFDLAESRQPVRYFAQVGDQVPIHASSAGRALLAQMTLAEREALYRRIDFTRYSPTAPASAQAVEAELRAAAERGYHQSYAEYTPDLAGVALAVPVDGRRLSIVVVGPVSRCLERRPALAVALGQELDALFPSG